MLSYDNTGTDHLCSVRTALGVGMYSAGAASLFWSQQMFFLFTCGLSPAGQNYLSSQYLFCKVCSFEETHELCVPDYFLEGIDIKKIDHNHALSMILTEK